VRKTKKTMAKEAYDLHIRKFKKKKEKEPDLLKGNDNHGRKRSRKKEIKRDDPSRKATAR